GIIDDSANYTYAQAVTDSDGIYRFDYVLPDQSYYLIFRAPVGYTFTTMNAGSDAALDSDANASGRTALFTFAAGVENLDFDAGLKGTPAAYDFAIKDGAANDDLAQATAVDSEGNVYVAGSFRGTVDFDPGVGVYSLTAAGGSDVFVAKYSSKGALLWAKAMGGTGDDAANAVSIGADGVVCVSGSFSATADFISGPGVYNLTAAGAKDAFVLKMDSLGGLIWARGMGGAGDEIANDVAVGTDGSVYSTGYFATLASGTNVDFDPGDGVYNLTSIGPKDVFVSKLDTDGNFVWAKRVGGTGWAQGMSIGNGIAVADDDTVYITGSFQGTADFDPGPNLYTLVCAGDTDAFVSKLDQQGNFLWAKRVGGANEVYGADLALSFDGSVHVTGGFQGVVDFDPGAGVYNLNSEGFRRLYAMKLTSSGNFVWAAGFGGTGWDLAGDIAVDDAGGVYVSGGFQGNADFDPGAGAYTLASAGQKDAFALKLNSSGTFQWAKRTGGVGDDSANGIAVYSPTGEVYTAGYFHGSADFDPGAATYQLTSSGGRDAFLAKFTAPTAAPLTVTINQGTTQADPATAAPIVFRVVFSASVADFTASDVTIGGTAPGAYVSAVSPVGNDGTTFNVSVSGMTGSGTVTAAINAGMAHNALGTPNAASTSTDNVVAYSHSTTSGPIISKVVVGEAASGGNKILESNEQLVVTWNVNSPAGVASRTVRIDGQNVSTIYGPFSNNYAAVFGPLSAGQHEYTIQVTDNNGATTTETGAFTVQAASVAGPTISKVVVAESASGGNKILESNEQLVVTWNVNSPAGVASRTVKI
ncbi:MAG: hypothetical protein GX594_01420, partial [Pirellulaceae bacterium]|nr:hypothetical protein [Pirellulaceae bacterium]